MTKYNGEKNRAVDEIIFNYTPLYISPIYYFPKLKLRRK